MLDREDVQFRTELRAEGLVVVAQHRTLGWLEDSVVIDIDGYEDQLFENLSQTFESWLARRA